MQWNSAILFFLCASDHKKLGVSARNLSQSSTISVDSVRTSTPFSMSDMAGQLTITGKRSVTHALP